MKKFRMDTVINIHLHFVVSLQGQGVGGCVRCTHMGWGEGGMPGAPIGPGDKEGVSGGPIGAGGGEPCVRRLLLF